jgi:hypothetical protein
MTECKLKGLEFWYDSRVLFELIRWISNVGNVWIVTSCEKDRKDGLHVLEIRCKLLKVDKVDRRDTTLNHAFKLLLIKMSRVPRHFTRVSNNLRNFSYAV